jgi:5-methylcytosine-specific restriction endonuclease McrA
MARPKLRADFFVDQRGVVLAKARPVPSAMRKWIFERDGWACKLCGQAVALFRSRIWPGSSRYVPVGHVDHFVPRARGGQNDPENLRLLCETCNESRGAAL